MILFHKCFYHFLRILIKPYFFFTNYRYKLYKPKAKNYLVLSNHVTNWDFFLAGLCLPHHMYFVASEHIIRKNFTGRLIKFLVDPVPRKKGAPGSEAAKAIIDRLSKGHNVWMAVEGSRCFNGETGTISPANAKLVKDSGVALITLAFHGGYLINPRWAEEKRRGPYWGAVVHEYSPEELATMTDEQLNKQIYDDIYVDAFADQKVKMAKYKCKNPAENLERALYICPKCHEFATLHSHKDRLNCGCGLNLRFNEYGFFESLNGDEPQFDNILAWDKWQVDLIPEKLSEYKDPDEAIFSDDGQILFTVKDGVKLFIREGIMALYNNRLEVCGRVFKFEDITKMSLSMADNILFTTSEGRYFEVRTNHPRSSVKYLIAVRHFQGKPLILR